MIRTLLFRLLLTAVVSATLGVAVFAPARAAPHAPDGDRITITLISDRQHNSAAAWYDADGRLRTQTDVPLLHQDPETRRWSASMVYTRRSPGVPLDTLFQSSGRFARCEIRVNSALVAEHTARGRHATSSCRPRNP
ncbi:hypothetical protein IA539_21910 [Gordonia sp. zg691]|uniref:hypothetical protein n=1 Tax=Gordonia jinghuaiqii TaxID=2758710 RepID=UPI0016624137|nr:hypothetical protein [Gordonia jinghuaiqii]MBD0863829.1 hypothetical protein [Gordonia jinghuaiqii]